MTILQGAILGIVQGLGEFLPISSSAHLLLVSRLLQMESTPAFKIFEILLHVGTLVPILLVFWKDWIDMIAHPIKNPTLRLLFLASLPALVFYVLFDMDALDSGWCLGPMFFVTSLLLLGIDFFSRRQTKPQSTVGVRHALTMGIMQGFGLFPGISRSGSTIFGGVLSGLDRRTAAKFSFMMSAPAVVASLLVEGKHALEENLLSEIELIPTVCGVVLAALVGILTIRWFLRMIVRMPMAVFALYVALLAVAILVLQLGHSPLLPLFQAPEGMQILRFLK